MARKETTIDILAVVDKLELLATSGKKLPIGRKTLVDPDKLLELVDQLRAALPQDVAEASAVLKKREELLNQSLGEARRIRSSAESEFRSRLEDSQLVKEAKKHAETIVEEAQQKAQRLLDMADADGENRRASADRYSQESLYKLEQQVAGILSTIRNGIQMLDARQTAAAN